MFNQIEYDVRSNTGFYVECRSCNGDGYHEVRIMGTDHSEPELFPCEWCDNSGLVYSNNKYNSAINDIRNQENNGGTCK